jgi:AcrR family transcriptional regulator
MTRRYASALRAEQAEDTRSRILAALAAQLATAPDDFSLAQVAAQAGVSLRTVHHHFPDSESRVAALATWIDAQVGISGDGPKSVGDIVPYARRMCETFFANEQLLRAQAVSGVATQVRRRRRRKREEQLREIIGHSIADPQAAARVAALMTWLINADTSIALKDRLGFDNEEATRVAVWMVRVLLDAAMKGDPP